MRQGTVSVVALFLSLALAACGAEESAPGAGTSGEAPEAGAALADAYPDAVTADPDHYSVVFENDALRIVKVAYGPGETSVVHYHPASCAINVGPSSWSMTELDGTVTENTGAHGDFSCEEEYVHTPENTSTGTSEAYLVEFADGAVPGTDLIEGDDAVAVDPEHYTVEFENEVARILRIRYEPGDQGIEHGHPANCIVWLESAAAQGEEDAVGALQCSDAEVHTPGGDPDVPVELIAVELKGQETADGPM